MFRAYAVTSVPLAAMLLLSAVMKLTRHQHVLAVFETVGVPLGWIPLLAGAEIAGAAGLLVGLAAPPFGIAAGAGVAVYFLAATAAHLRVRDWAIASPALPGLLAILALTLRVASA